MDTFVKCVEWTGKALIWGSVLVLFWFALVVTP